jgi:hypothetical protein
MGGKWGSGCGPWCGWCGACTAREGPRPNAECPRCGTEFYKAKDDVGDLCDRCCRDRDARPGSTRVVK